MPIFISYSRNDRDFVDKLAANLVANKAWVWVDRWELKVGDSLISKIQEAIQEASALLVVLSKASVASEWCKKELTAGLVRELEEKRVIVLPVLLEDCQIPLFLRDKLYADFREDFDEGLRSVLDATAKVTSEARGRIESPESFTDWALDWYDEEGLFCMRITLVEHVKANPYSVLSEVIVKANEVATRRYRQYVSADLGWFGRNLIIEIMGELGDKEKIFVLLEDQFPKERSFGLGDPKNGASYDIKTKTRLLGEDNGSDVLVNLGGQLGVIRDTVRLRSRKFTDGESVKVAAILNTPIGA